MSKMHVVASQTSLEARPITQASVYRGKISYIHVNVVLPTKEDKYAL